MKWLLSKVPALFPIDKRPLNIDNYQHIAPAGVAELADARDSKSRRA